MSQVHVTYNGRTEDLEFDDVFPTERRASIGIAEATDLNPNSLTTTQIKTALAQHYDVGINEFQDHYVEVAKNGNITVRQNAVFG